MKSLLLVLVLGLNLSAAAMAQNIVTQEILGPFPTLGSIEESGEIGTLLEYQKNRTTEQCAKAQQESNASLETFYGSLLSANELKAAKNELRWLTVKTGTYILLFKKKYNRPRPYLTHPEIKPCIDLESSKAYPSGHATLARVYARVLAVMYPERSGLFMKHSDEIALNRVIGGVHHPSDIEAGKVLGDAIADDYLADESELSELVY